MGGRQSAFRWGIERRLEFIEFRLFWEGHVNRGDLVGAFGISVNQASTDFNRYLALAPGKMAYDRSARTYVRGARFQPLFLKPEPDRYLSQLRSTADGILAHEETWIGQLPPFASAPTPVRGVDPGHLRAVLEAIHGAQAIEVEYQSLASPAPRWRWIAPHALAFDGFRWHTRAYCFTDHRLEEFLLSRILGVRDTRPSEIDASQDADWHTLVTLEIGPHPGLSDEQKKVIALDYAMRDGKATLTVRKALLYYTLKRLGLDTDPSARNPADQQIVLLS